MPSDKKKSRYSKSTVDNLNFEGDDKEIIPSDGKYFFVLFFFLTSVIFIKTKSKSVVTNFSEAPPASKQRKRPLPPPNLDYSDDSEMEGVKAEELVLLNF